MAKTRKHLLDVWPEYFAAFDASEETKVLSAQSDQFPFLASYLSFIEHSNFHARENNARNQLSLETRMALHQTEARVCHLFKPHLELVDAYRWHQISARRQENVFAGLRDGGLESHATPMRTALL